MPKLQWDQPGNRTFEQGVDQGVLYLQNGLAVPWNGLTAVSENSDRSVESIYFDGVKINDNVTGGNFSATMKAMTYPDEFLLLEGVAQMIAGVYAGEQAPQTFGLSYRTRVGSDLDVSSSHYKIHLLYNVTAIASQKNYETMSDDPEIVEFEWGITTVPEEIPGFRPTSHFIFESRYIPPELLAEIELMLYGGETANPNLIPMVDLVRLIFGYYTIEIIDNNDGTWTARSDIPGNIVMLTATEFQINNADVVSIDADTYQISSTRG